MAGHSIAHVEISAKDPQAAAKFYGDLFGWKIEAFPEMSYFTFAAESGPGGGFTKVDNELYKSGEVLVYVGTDDIEATLAKVEKLGGKTLMGKTEIPTIGWFAIFSDPAGNKLALFTGLPQQ